MSKVTFLGGGSFGTALAVLLAEKNNIVNIYNRDKTVVDEINIKRTNEKYMKDIKIPENVTAFGDIEKAVEGADYIVLSAQIELENGSYDEIKATMADFTQRRVTKQPLSLPSAGSTFKRPEGHFAAKLIDDSGLRGLTLRGAQVSEKHCGFVVNLGNAKAKDILDLMYIVKSTVKAKYGITLEEEVKILGED